MTIKPGVRLTDLGALSDKDLRTAQALSLYTIDEFVDFTSLFPDAAGRLFDDVAPEAGGFRSKMASAGTVAALDDREIALVQQQLGFGALPPTVADAEAEAVLLLDEVDAAPPGPAEDTPRVRLSGLGPVRHQGDRGTCVAHTVCAVIERALADDGSLDLSEQHLYWLSKLNDGLPNVGGTFQRVAVPLALQYGVCDEATWPYVSQQLTSEAQGPPPDAVEAAGPVHRPTRGLVVDPTWVESITGLLDRGHAVGISVPAYPNWSIALRSGDIPMPLPGTRSKSGHAMCIVGYGYDDAFLGGGYVIVRNSWGTGWGDQSPHGAGHGTLPFAYVRNYAWEAFAVEGPARTA